MESSAVEYESNDFRRAPFKVWHMREHSAMQSCTVSLSPRSCDDSVVVLSDSTTPGRGCGLSAKLPFILATT
eukprot:3667511-Rhodomonas_salina.1